MGFLDTGGTVGQDVFKEAEAYRTQYAYDPSSVIGIQSLAGVSSMADITPEWVRSIFKVEHMNASGNVAIHRPYSQPNGEFNTGSTKVTMETTRDGLINAYPTQRGALQNMSEDYTLRDLPGVYYKKRRK